ncbi:MAG: hypothetical protein KDJ49_04390 [Alphaproteobacteria bacterium]|nr:hypothetical protein [Alphaproteobacteria bacterium]USO08299.1 MAG: hypothetical protein H6866_03545 [Rhodospirillales bacterium]
MRPFYKSVILTGVAGVTFGAFAPQATAGADTPINSAYNNLVAANSSIAARRDVKAIDRLEDAKWALRENEIMNKNNAEVQADETLRSDIAAIVGILRGQDTNRFDAAAAATQKVEDAVQARIEKKDTHKVD